MLVTLRIIPTRLFHFNAPIKLSSVKPIQKNTCLQRRKQSWYGNKFSLNQYQDWHHRVSSRSKERCSHYNESHVRCFNCGLKNHSTKNCRYLYEDVDRHSVSNKFAVLSNIFCNCNHAMNLCLWQHCCKMSASVFIFNK